MKRALIAMALLMTLLIGCTAGVILHESFAPEVLAQAPPPAHQYSACITVIAPKYHAIQYLNSGQAPTQERMVRVPEGWTPVGGGMTTTGGVIYMCR